MTGHKLTTKLRQELSQLRLILPTRKTAQGTYDSKAGAETWLAGRSKSFQRGKCFEGVKEDLLFEIYFYHLNFHSIQNSIIRESIPIRLGDFLF